jgi:hypothetical protein
MVIKKKSKKKSLRKSNTNKKTKKRSKKKSRKVSKEKIKQNIKKSYRKKKIRRSSTKKKKVTKTTKKKKVVNKKYFKKMRISRAKSKRRKGLRVYTKKLRQKKTNILYGGAAAAAAHRKFVGEYEEPVPIEKFNQPSLFQHNYYQVVDRVKEDPFPVDLPDLPSMLADPDFSDFDLSGPAGYTLDEINNLLRNQPIDQVEEEQADVKLKDKLIKLLYDTLQALVDKDSREGLNWTEDVDFLNKNEDVILKKLNDVILKKLNDDPAAAATAANANTIIVLMKDYVHSISPIIELVIIYEWFLNKLILLLPLSYHDFVKRTDIVAGALAPSSCIIPHLSELHGHPHTLDTRSCALLAGGRLSGGGEKPSAKVLTSLWDSHYTTARRAAPAAHPIISNDLPSVDHYIKHIKRIDTFHDFGKGERIGKLGKKLATFLPRTYTRLRKYLEESLFIEARGMLRDMSIPGSGSWEKLLREYTFKHFSDDMKFITIPCKGDTDVANIYKQLKKFNFGIILEEERLNKSGGILKTDNAYRMAKLMVTKVLDIKMFGSLTCWFDPGSGTSDQMKNFYNYVDNGISGITNAANFKDDLLNTLITMPAHALYGIENIVDIQLYDKTSARVITASLLRSPPVWPQNLGLALIYKPTGFCGYVNKVSVNIIFQTMVLLFLLQNNGTMLVDLMTNGVRSPFLSQLGARAKFIQEPGLIVLHPILISSDEKSVTIETLLTLFSNIYNDLQTPRGSEIHKCVQILLILKRSGDYGQLVGLEDFKLAAQALKGAATLPLTDEQKRILKTFMNPTFESMDNALISAAHSIGMSTLSKNIANELEELKYGIGNNKWLASNDPAEIVSSFVYEFGQLTKAFAEYENTVPKNNVTAPPDVSQGYLKSYKNFREIWLKTGKILSANPGEPNFVEITKNIKTMRESLHIIKICHKILNTILDETILSSAFLEVTKILQAFSDIHENLQPGRSGENKMCMGIRDMIMKLVKIKDIKNITHYDPLEINKSKDLYEELSIATGIKYISGVIQTDRDEVNALKLTQVNIKVAIQDFFGRSKGRGAKMVQDLYVERENAIQIN